MKKTDMKMAPKLQISSRRGQGMVEFALILPIVLTAFFTIIELARLYHAWVAVENGARFGVRYAITGEFDESRCDEGTCDNDSEEEVARVATVKEVAWTGLRPTTTATIPHATANDNGRAASDGGVSIRLLCEYCLLW
jgi:Flp pilus assembly protein TadG